MAAVRHPTELFLDVPPGSESPSGLACLSVRMTTFSPLHVWLLRAVCSLILVMTVASFANAEPRMGILSGQRLTIPPSQSALLSTVSLDEGEPPASKSDRYFKIVQGHRVAQVYFRKRAMTIDQAVALGVIDVSGSGSFSALKIVNKQSEPVGITIDLPVALGTARHDAFRDDVLGLMTRGLSQEEIWFELARRKAKPKLVFDPDAYELGNLDRFRDRGDSSSGEETSPPPGRDATPDDSVAEPKVPAPESAADGDSTTDAASRQPADVPGNNVDNATKNGQQQKGSGNKASQSKRTSPRPKGGKAHNNGQQPCDEDEPKRSVSRSIIVVLDASSSMSGKLAQAKAAIAGFVSSLRPKTRVALRSFGGSCSTSLLVDFNSAEEVGKTLVQRAAGTAATGDTALAIAVSAAAADLARESAKEKIMVVLTDGQETCKGDPVAAAMGAKAAQVKITTNIVGLAVSERAAKQLEKVAAATGGRYVSANQVNDLKCKLQQAVNGPPKDPFEPLRDFIKQRRAALKKLRLTDFEAARLEQEILDRMEKFIRNNKGATDIDPPHVAYARAKREVTQAQGQSAPLKFDPFAKGTWPYENSAIVTVRGGNVFTTNEKGQIVGRIGGWRGEGNGTNLEPGTYAVEGNPGTFAEKATSLSDGESFPLGKPGDTSIRTNLADKFDVFVGSDVPTFHDLLKGSNTAVAHVLDDDPAIANLGFAEKLQRTLDHTRNSAPDVARQLADQMSSLEGLGDLAVDVIADALTGAPGEMRETLQSVQHVAEAINILKNAKSEFELEYAGRMLAGEAISQSVSKAIDIAARGAVGVVGGTGTGTVLEGMPPHASDGLDIASGEFGPLTATDGPLSSRPFGSSEGSTQPQSTPKAPSTGSSSNTDVVVGPPEPDSLRSAAEWSAYPPTKQPDNQLAASPPTTTETTPHAPRKPVDGLEGPPEPAGLRPHQQGDDLELDHSPPKTQSVPHRELDLGTVSPDEVPKLGEIDPKTGTAKRVRKTPEYERGPPSSDTTGTGHRKGMHFNEYNAAEIGSDLRHTIDQSSGQIPHLRYKVRGEDVAPGSGSQVTSRSFTQDTSLDAPQSKSSAYSGSGYDRGHLVLREAVKGSADAERAVDQMPLVAPMAPSLNRGKGSPWRKFEQRIIKEAQSNLSTDPNNSFVTVEVLPQYGKTLKTLRDGTPIPESYTGTIRDHNGNIVYQERFLNR